MGRVNQFHDKMQQGNSVGVTGKPGGGAAAAKRIAALVGVRLDERQTLFVEAVARGVPYAEAARSAGYTSPAASIMKSAAVRQAISLTVLEIFKMEGAPIALKVLLDIVRNDKENSKVRADCAKALLDRAGYTARPTEANATPQKDLNEMSTDELKNLVDRLEGELAERAQPLDAPDETGVSAEVLDLLD